MRAIGRRGAHERVSRAILLALLGTATSLALAGAGPAETAGRTGRLELPPAAQEYVDRLASLSPDRGPAAVESLFVLATRAADALTLPDESGGTNTVEVMDDSVAALAARLLPGISILRSSERNGAVPDDSFFLDLSRRRGTRSDVEFFRVRVEAVDDAGWPAWVEQTWDYGGCTRFGSGRIVEEWAAWRSYANRFPGHYAAALAEAVESLQREFLEGDCVCGGREDLLRELRLFVQRFPDDELLPAVRARIAQVESGTAPVRENCRPG